MGVRPPTNMSLVPHSWTISFAIEGRGLYNCLPIERDPLKERRRIFCYTSYKKKNFLRVSCHNVYFFYVVYLTMTSRVYSTFL